MELAAEEILAKKLGMSGMEGTTIVEGRWS